MDALTLVSDYLNSLQRQGVTRLSVDDDARAVLRGWMLAAKRGARAAGAGAVAAALPDVPPAALPAAVGSAAAVSEPPADPELSLREGIPDLSEQDMTEEEPEAFFRPGGTTEEEVWTMAQRLLPRWEPLQKLGTLRSVPVFGTGNRHATVMFVGDAPGYQDEKAQEPFRGEAGEKLDGMLKAMGLTRESVYLTLMLKFRPAQPRQTINTRPPTEKELRASLPVTDWEIRMVNPRVIVALGVIAARGLLGGGNLPLSAYQQQQGQYRGIPVVVTHHPSYLLRTGDMAERRRLWEEMLRVMEMAGLPISEKQRGFFLPKKR